MNKKSAGRSPTSGAVGNEDCVSKCYTSNGQATYPLTLQISKVCTKRHWGHSA